VILYFLGGGAFNSGPAEVFTSYAALWESLPAVKANRVVKLDPTAWWDGYSVSAAKSCLQELSRALETVSQK
jgi:iron complex transport system substrate-binding protein